MSNKCQRCQSERVVSITAKCSDCCSVSFKNDSFEGYVPDDLGIGGGDYVEFSWCLECGQLQEKFPLTKSEIEKETSDEEVLEFYADSFTEGEEIPRRYIPSILEQAKDLSPKFHSFMQNFIDNNSDIYRAIRIPSAQKFLEMYKNNITEVDDAR